MKSKILKKFFSYPLALAALAVVIFFVVTAIGFELYSVYCSWNDIEPVYARSNQQIVYMEPNAKHFFGTDYQGRDVFLRTLAGSASALKVGVISGLIALSIGVCFGVVSGYFGGKADDFTVWLYSTFAAMPTLLFILAFALLATQGFLSSPLQNVLEKTAKLLNTTCGMLGVYLAIGLTGWVTICRVIRGETMKLKKMAYISAAKVAGVSDLKIIMVHILPNVFHLAIIYFTTLFASAVMLEVIVSYLGLGSQNMPSWGVMISDGQARLWNGIWWEITFASGALMLLVLALNILGDALRDAMDPRK